MNNAENNEQGNAVTLTLLGLAVAIFAGVVVLYFIGKNAVQPVPLPATVPVEDAQLAAEHDDDPRAGWRSYENSTFDVRFEYPEGWAVATGTMLGVPVLTVYDARQSLDASSTFGVHDHATRVSFYPQGLPVEGPAYERVQSATIVPVAQASALDYVLSTGKPWATRVSFDRTPASWESYGFVIGTAQVEEREDAYMRGDTGISPEEFDVFSGDRIAVHGFVDARAWSDMSEILRSIALVFEKEGGVQEGSAQGEERIMVEAPRENELVGSPLIVRGQAVGSWYFEGSFPVRLETEGGETLAEVPATALDEWMTEAFVPFEVSLVFGSTTATSGVLVLARDNPSGLSEFDAEVRVPVRFSPDN